MRKAIDMRKIETVLRRIRSKHVLMIFDSCFSGSIFNINRAAPSDFIQEKVAEPVRQIITAGNENEQVPDRSVFKTVFLQGIEKGYADRNADGYVTGEELGAYIEEKVINYSRKAQHPQFGKINDPKLDKGDFVFQLASSGAVIEQPSTQTRLKIDSNVSGASIYLDGNRIGSTPLPPRMVTPGEHRIRVEKDGYETYQKRVSFEHGRTVSMYIDLSVVTPRTGRLYVNTNPSDARIRILNIKPKFLQGMELDAGKYLIETSAEGYETKTLWITLASHEDKTVEVTLQKAKPKKGRLFVSTDPPNARVKFLNLNRGYYSGMELPAGRYHLEISASQYETKEEWLQIENEEEQRISVRLKQKEPQPGDTWTEPVTGMEFVWVPGGCYQMGSYDGDNDERPVHEVCVDGFWMGKYEVTQVQWERVMGNNPSRFKKGNNYPVERVSWHDAKEFIRKLNTGGFKFRLPTEAEWEYAARSGGKREMYSGGNDVNRVAWYVGNSGMTTHSVGTKAANGLGLYDMSGNVWEWCEDSYGDYSSGSVTNPRGPYQDGFRVLRGGSWGGFARNARSAFRFRRYPDFRYSSFGFRVSRRAEDSE
jgi:formylglycine-generating enzyme required for sulfatase activity